MKTILISGTNEKLEEIAKSIADSACEIINLEELLPYNDFDALVNKVGSSTEILAVCEVYFGFLTSSLLKFFEWLEKHNFNLKKEIKLVLVAKNEVVSLDNYFKLVKTGIGLKLRVQHIFKLPQNSLAESIDFENELTNLKNSLNAKTEQFSASKNRVTIYTDGACSGNPGKGGWGAILISGDREKEFSGYEENTTNNKMELTAVIKALEALKQICEVELYSDSAYVVNAINNDWLGAWKNNNWLGADKKPVKNQELWEQLDELISKHSVHFNKVKGHSDNEYNNRCDKLATGEISKHS